jgi:hypothetical protein
LKQQQLFIMSTDEELYMSDDEFGQRYFEPHQVDADAVEDRARDGGLQSTDDELYMDDDEFVERYLQQPSPHRVDAAADGDNVEVELEDLEGGGGLPILNRDGPMDYEGAPFPNTYEEIPLPAKFRDIISIQIKKTGFVRQKVLYQ